jgi:dTMP kinase
MFLVFEGIDGSGKSTQARLLVEHLRRHDQKDAVLVREPGGTDLGEKLRALILDGAEDLAPETELFLFMAARAHLARTRILPDLKAGRVVVSDRFVWSSVVYQGIVAGNDPHEILRMGRVAAPGISVARTFLIDLDPEVGLRRVKAPNRMEERGLDFQKRVRKAFLDLARKRTNKIVVIDGRGTIAQVHKRVLESLPRRGWSACSSL